jgi:hypothetical protein
VQNGLVEPAHLGHIGVGMQRVAVTAEAVPARQPCESVAACGGTAKCVGRPHRRAWLSAVCSRCSTSGGLQALHQRPAPCNARRAPVRRVERVRLGSLLAAEAAHTPAAALVKSHFLRHAANARGGTG